MSIRMDALVQRMTDYYDALLCDLDYRARRLRRKTRVRTMLGLFEIARLSRRVKGDDGLPVWTATTKLVRMVGVLGKDAQPAPAKTRRFERTSAGIVPAEEQDDWDYFNDHLLWAFELQHDSCIEWIKTDLALVYLNQRSWRTAVIDVTRGFALRVALLEAARWLENEIDFNEVIGPELQARATEPPNATGLLQADQASREPAQKPFGDNVVGVNGASPPKQG
jgi:hypothetical protein